MKTELQVRQEKRGAYERKRRKLVLRRRMMNDPRERKAKIVTLAPWYVRLWRWCSGLLAA